MPTTWCVFPIVHAPFLAVSRRIGVYMNYSLSHFKALQATLRRKPRRHNHPEMQSGDGGIWSNLSKSLKIQSTHPLQPEKQTQRQVQTEDELHSQSQKGINPSSSSNQTRQSGWVWPMTWTGASATKVVVGADTAWMALIFESSKKFHRIIALPRIHIDNTLGNGCTAKFLAYKIACSYLQRVSLMADRLWQCLTHLAQLWVAWIRPDMWVDLSDYPIALIIVLALTST